MRRFEEFARGLERCCLASIASALTVAQIILAVLLYQPGWELVRWAGWICIWSAGVFGVLPIITLRRKGRVPQGKSYVHTTALVDSGIYALVRHPQGGVAGLLINLGIMLIARHWLVILPGGIAMLLFYLDTFKEDQHGIDKFGDDYRRYMQRVPRVNVVAGAIRRLRRGWRE